MKDRSMATAPYPRAARKLDNYGERYTGGQIARWYVGSHTIITMSDGSEVRCCSRPHGHVKAETRIACATATVARLNDAAGIPEEVR